MARSKDKLFEVADRQQGYFTALQAQECGISRSNFHYHLSSGSWEKVFRGIYRLAHYPVTERPELVLWSLWSQDRKGIPQGVWSHETALEIYDLSDVMPAKMHMTVPKRFRKRASIPKQIVLHFDDLSASDVREQQGYRITTPLRTLIDVEKEERLSLEHVIQAVKDTVRKGLLSRTQLPSSLQEFLQ